jgi:hypothetical protein
MPTFHFVLLIVIQKTMKEVFQCKLANPRFGSSVKSGATCDKIRGGIKVSSFAFGLLAAHLLLYLCGIIIRENRCNLRGCVHGETGDLESSWSVSALLEIRNLDSHVRYHFWFYSEFSY